MINKHTYIHTQTNITENVSHRYTRVGPMLKMKEETNKNDLVIFTQLLITYTDFRALPF